MNIFESQEEYELQGHMDFQGLTIDIENKKGTYRTGVDPNGKPWRTYMYCPYGRIRHTSTISDGEELDVYIGENKKSDKVYQIEQMKSPDFEEFDEYKYMLGFDNMGEAVEAYLKQYNDAGFLGTVREIPFKDFKEKIDEYISRSHTKPEVNEIFSKWSHIIGR